MRVVSRARLLFNKEEGGHVGGKVLGLSESGAVALCTYNSIGNPASVSLSVLSCAQGSRADGDTRAQMREGCI